MHFRIHLFFSFVYVYSFSEELTTNITNLSPEQIIQFNKALSMKTIDETFYYNSYTELRKFIQKRENLIGYNKVMVYLFHLCQSLGVIINALSASSNNQNYIWLGIMLNALATLISLWEKTNTLIIKKLMDDIKLIRDGDYVDEGSLVEGADLTKKEGKPKKSDKVRKNDKIKKSDNGKKEGKGGVDLAGNADIANNVTKKEGKGKKREKGGLGEADYQLTSDAVGDIEEMKGVDDDDEGTNTEMVPLMSTV